MTPEEQHLVNELREDIKSLKNKLLDTEEEYRLKNNEYEREQEAREEADQKLEQIREIL